MRGQWLCDGFPVKLEGDEQLSDNHGGNDEALLSQLLCVAATGAKNKQLFSTNKGSYVIYYDSAG